MSCDVLFLLELGFVDLKYLGQCFVCLYGLLIEGLLVSVLDFVVCFDVKCVGFEWLWFVVIDVFDDVYQGLLVFVLGCDWFVLDDVQMFGDVCFVIDVCCIFELLVECYGFLVLY